MQNSSRTHRYPAPGANVMYTIQWSIMYAMVSTAMTCSNDAQARCMIAAGSSCHGDLDCCTGKHSAGCPTVMAAVARRAASAGADADANAQAAPQLWRPTAVNNLAASLAQDSSLRVRLKRHRFLPNTADGS